MYRYDHYSGVACSTACEPRSGLSCQGMIRAILIARGQGPPYTMKQSVFISPTAARVLDAAQILIQNNGYNGFSYEDLSRMVGLRKPSLHHHFPKIGRASCRERVCQYV